MTYLDKYLLLQEILTRRMGSKEHTRLRGMLKLLLLLSLLLLLLVVVVVVVVAVVVVVLLLLLLF